MSSQTKKNIILGIVVAAIVIVIGYLQIQKDANEVNVPAGSADIPLPTVTSTSTSADETSATSSVPGSSASTTTAKSTTASPGVPTLLGNESTAAAEGYLTLSQKLAMYPRAKELVAPSGFINTPPFKITDLIGKKVILVDFWTYSCINCQRTIPYLNSWYAKYKDQGLVIIGVHTPEFEFEKDINNVTAAVQKYGIQYPVVLDSQMGTWNAYGNEYWPHDYLIDIDGFISADHIGEGDYQNMETKIQNALDERYARLGSTQKVTNTLSTDASVNAVLPTSGISPETYFGSNRNDYFANGTSGVSGQQNFSYDLKTVEGGSTNQFYLGGSWNIVGEYAESEGSTTLAYKYTAKNMYFVADSDGPIDIQIYNDGVFVKTLTINGAQLYQLISNSDSQPHTIEIRIPKAGLKAYTFTFG